MADGTFTPYLGSQPAPDSAAFGGPRPGPSAPFPSLGTMQNSAQRAINAGQVRPNYPVDWGAAGRAARQASASYTPYGPALSPTPNVQVFTPQGGTSAYGTPASTRTVPYTDAQLQANFQQALLGDPTLAGQLGKTGSLRAQLASQWQGGVITPAQQALISYGGNLPQSIVDQLKGTPAPSLQTPYGTFSLGASLADALGDPTIAAQAAANPYSTLNQLSNQYDRLAGQSLRGVYGRGLGHSGAVGNILNDVNQQEGYERYNQAQALLQQLGGNINAFNTQLTNAGQTQEQALASASQDLIAKMQAGLITLPTSYTVTTPATSPATQPYYRALTGTYGSKPLY